MPRAGQARGWSGRNVAEPASGRQWAWLGASTCPSCPCCSVLAVLSLLSCPAHAPRTRCTPHATPPHAWTTPRTFTPAQARTRGRAQQQQEQQQQQGGQQPVSGRRMGGGSRGPAQPSMSPVLPLHLTSTALLVLLLLARPAEVARTAAPGRRGGGVEGGLKGADGGGHLTHGRHLPTYNTPVCGVCQSVAAGTPTPPPSPLPPPSTPPTTPSPQPYASLWLKKHEAADCEAHPGLAMKPHGAPSLDR
jgi:hypothetical protein